MIRLWHSWRRLWPTLLASTILALGLHFALSRVNHLVAYRFEHPRAFWLLLLIPSLCVLAWHTLASVSRWHRVLMATTRSLLVLGAACVLAMPRVSVETTARCSVMVVDVSQSMANEAVQSAEQWVTDYARAALPLDTIVRVAFDATPRLVERSFIGSRSSNGDQAASDYDRALGFASAQCGTDKARRIVLFGDGLDTRGTLAVSTEQVQRLGYELDVVPSRVAPRSDVAVRRVTPPSDIEVRRPFRVGVDLRATRSSRVTLEFELDGAPNARESARSLALAVGDAHLEFESVATRAGKASLRVLAKVTPADAVAENNQASVAFEVRGSPEVLYIDGKGNRASSFVSALTAQRFKVDVISPSEFPRVPGALEHHAFVVLSDLGREQLSAYADVAIERFVREGGGLLFAGGSSTQAGAGWSGSTLEHLLPVVLTAPETQQTADVALVLVIDRSGSMSGLPLEMAKAACAATVQTLETSDWIEVIAFDAKPVRYVTMQQARARAAIANDVGRILAGGDTELFPALDMAFQDLLAVQARRKHVLLLTDGQSPKAGLTEMVQSMVGDSMTLTIVGLGSDVDTELLRHLAARGGGRYHAVENPNNLPRIFTRETQALKQGSDPRSRFEIHVKRRAEFLRGIPTESLPPVRGYIKTRKKSGAPEVILESERAEPILARMRYGIGWSLAWTSDLRSEWAGDWVRWPYYSRFFAQMVREHYSRRTLALLPMSVEQNGDQLAVEVSAVGPDGAFDNDRSILLKVVGPDARSFEHELVNVAPGLYRSEFRLPRLGDYLLQATHRRLDLEASPEPIGESRAYVSYNYPLEFERLAPDLAVLERLAVISNGRFDPTPRSLSESGRTPTRRERPDHVPWLLGLLALFALDLFVRRVRFNR